MTSKTSNNYKILGEIGLECDSKTKCDEEENKEISESDDYISDDDTEESEDDEGDEDQELTINIIENHNPCLNAYYDPTRIEFTYINEDETLMAIRKGICFRCSAYRQVMYTNLCGNYNCSQICERCISDMFNDARN